jgi:hypothetical protein
MGGVFTANGAVASRGKITFAQAIGLVLKMA